LNWAGFLAFVVILGDAGQEIEEAVTSVTSKPEKN